MDTTGLSSIILSFPFSYTFAGGIHPTSGEPYSIDTMGYYWENEKLTATTASLIRGGDTELRPAVGAAQKRGYSVRFSFSCIYLFREAYHFIESGETYEYGRAGAGETLRLFPFSLVYSGLIEQSNGGYLLQNAHGLQWTSYATDMTNAGRQYFSNSDIQSMPDTKKYGFSVRHAGSGSWLYLFREAYHFIESGTSSINIIDQPQFNFPFGLAYSGSVYFADGNSNQGSSDGSLWIPRTYSDTLAHRFAYTLTTIYPQTNYNNKSGFSVHYITHAPISSAKPIILLRVERRKDGTE